MKEHSTKPLGTLIGELLANLTVLQKIRALFLLVLMVVASLSEVMTIGAVIPFLAVITSPEQVFLSPTLQPLINFYGFIEPTQLLLPLCLFFGFSAILSCVVRTCLLWLSIDFSFRAGVSWSSSIYRRTLYQPYLVSISRNSSEIINGISGKTSALTNTVLMLLNLVSSLVIMLVILSALSYISPYIALSTFGGLGVVYLGIALFTRRRLLFESQVIAHESTRVIKALQEGLGGLRDVIVDGSQEVYCRAFYEADFPHRRAYAITGFITQMPRLVIEAFAMILIALVAFISTEVSSDILKVVPILGAFALGAQRLLPVLQQAYAAWTGIKASQASLQDALNLLDQPLPIKAESLSVTNISFEHSIVVKDLTFAYFSDGPKVLNKVNFSIQKGKCVGIIGGTGSGKSTLLDVLMGLLEPNGGEILIDGHPLELVNTSSWQKLVAHVPQTIFMSDASVLENIAFGVPFDEIDVDLVVKCARLAQIHEVVESMPSKYLTHLGERGVRVSGGQRQRIGIARALYKNAKVLIFDEATSALDTKTELDVMIAIKDLRFELGSDITIIMVAHRVSTLRGCDEIFKLESGKLIHGVDIKSLV